MALNENQILNLLGDGNISDLSISSFESENELDYLLQQFEDDDYLGTVENDQLELANAVIFDESENVSEQTQIPESDVTENRTIGQYNIHDFPFIKKNEIQWTSTPFKNFEIKLRDLEITNHSIDILSPYQYFTKYFNDSFFESMAFHTNLYAVQNNVNNFQPTNAIEKRSLIAIQMMMGVLKYPRQEMYWQLKFRVNIIANTMTRNRFFSLRQHLHVINNLDIPRDNSDKFVKVRPLFDTLNSRCKQLSVERNISVDEQIVPFKGHLSIKQYMKGKPNPWGIKIFLLCGESGIVYNMMLYQGTATNIDKTLQKNFGLGGAVVLNLTQHLSANRHFLYFDNFFSSYNLFYALSKRKIYAAGTVRTNRFGNPPIISDKEILKLGRGTTYEITSPLGIGLVKWCDNKPIVMASNFITSGTPDVVKRWDKKNKRYIEVERPEIIKLYNKSMGGVDKHDQLVSYYRVFMKSKKWTLRMVSHAFDMAVSNSWLEYKQEAARINIPIKDQHDLLHFKITLVEELIMVGRCTPGKKRGRPSSSPCGSIADSRSPTPTAAGLSSKSLEFRPSESVSSDQIGHFPEIDKKKEATRCKAFKCKGKTHVFCTKCNIHLCFTKTSNCFSNYHEK